MSDKQNANHTTLPNTVQTDSRRRQFMLGLGAIVGTGVANKLLGGNGLSVAMAYEPRPNKASGTSKNSLFNVEQMRSLRVICQTVIPATNTLGAGDVDTHGFIENQLSHCFEESEKKSVIDSINLIIDSAESRHKTQLEKLSSVQATALLSDLDSAKNEFLEKDKTAFRFVKSLIVFGYYTSEEGASKELNYDAYPGGYTGSVALSDIGSAWGSLAYF
jgi:hypothetical protein